VRVGIRIRVLLKLFEMADYTPGQIQGLFSNPRKWVREPYLSFIPTGFEHGLWTAMKKRWIVIEIEL
jgi:hypothetical protein